MKSKNVYSDISTGLTSWLWSWSGECFSQSFRPSSSTRWVEGFPWPSSSAWCWSSPSPPLQPPGPCLASPAPSPVSPLSSQSRQRALKSLSWLWGIARREIDATVTAGKVTHLSYSGLVNLSQDESVNWGFASLYLIGKQYRRRRFYIYDVGIR